MNRGAMLVAPDAPQAISLDSGGVPIKRVVIYPFCERGYVLDKWVVTKRPRFRVGKSLAFSNCIPQFARSQMEPHVHRVPPGEHNHEGRHLRPRQHEQAGQRQSARPTPGVRSQAEMAGRHGVR